MAKDKKIISSKNKLNPAQLFGFCILIGGICIIFGTWLGTTNLFNQSSEYIVFIKSYLSIFINFVVPLIIILFYAYTVNNDTSDTLSIEQRADSVYYMGFILTLFAMTASLVALAANEELKFNAIVVNFGLALMTTILGLAIRIMWLQLSSQNLADAESILRDRIIRRSQDLQDQTEKVVASITALSNQLTDVSEPLKVSFDKLINNLDINEDISKKLEVLDRSADSAAQSLRIIANLAERLDISVSMLQNNINTDVINNVTDLSTSVSTANPKIVKMDNELSDKIENIQDSLINLQESIKKTDEIVLNSQATIEKKNSFRNRFKNRFKNLFKRK